MSQESQPIDLKAHREKWLKRLAAEIEKIESYFPKNNLVIDESCPAWVRKVEQEFSLAMLPAAKLRDSDFEITPKRMGALIGHMCEMAVWMTEWLGSTIENPPKVISVETTEEQMEPTKKFFASYEAWFNAMRRLAKLSLCSCVDQTYADMTDFLQGYTDGFSRKPKTFGFGDVGHTAIEIYQFMLVHWRFIDRLGSVREFHELLVKCLGAARVGDQKRVEKICQRVGLNFRKAGRPKQK
jgi:hypothetical protein